MTTKPTISIGHLILVWICSRFSSAYLVAANSTSDPLWRHQTLLSSPGKRGQLLQKLHLARSQLQPPVKHQEQLLLGHTGNNAHTALLPPLYQQDPLLRQLALLLPAVDDHNGLHPPSQQQDPLLRQLKSNHGGKAPKGLLVPKLDQAGLLTSHQGNVGGRFLSPPKQHLKSDRIMNMAHTLLGPEFKSSESALSDDKKRKLLNTVEAKVKALLFELEPRQKPSLMQSDQRNQQQGQKTAPLILDNSIIIGQEFEGFQSEPSPKKNKGVGKSSEFQEQSKRSKFQSLLIEMTKAMVALETVSQGRK